MNFIILGDKFQKRMKSKGCVGLIKINRYNIFQHQYKAITNTFPDAKIVYVCGFESKKFTTFIEKNYKDNLNLHIVQNNDYENYNSAYSLYLARDFLNDDCFICFGDNILESKFFNNIDNKLGSQILINNKRKNKLGCVIENSRIQNIFYDLDNYLSEIYFIANDDVLELKNIINNKTYHNCFIFEIINKLIDKNKNLTPCYLK